MKIKNQKDHGWPFYTFSEQYAHLYDLDRAYFNEKLAFDKRKRGRKRMLNYYIASASEFQYSWIGFLLSDKVIKIDVNLTNDDGTTSFREIHKFVYRDDNTLSFRERLSFNR